MITIVRNLVLVLCVAVSSNALSANKTLSQGTYKKLTKIQELMSAGDFATAITDLKVLDADVSKPEEATLNEAIVKQTLGFAYMSVERYDEAIVVFKRSLELELLPEGAADNVRYLIAQLYAGNGDFDTAIQYAEVWFAKLTEPKATEAIFMANLYAQVKRYSEAAIWAKKGISLSDKPKQSWYQLAVAAYFEDERFTDAAKTLTLMVSRWPDEAKYWEQLASVHMVLEQTDSALAVLKVAWSQKLLDKESTIKSLIQLAGSEGIPEHAAIILDEAIETGQIEANEIFLELLANAWTAAREDETAIATLARLAEVTTDGEPWLKQGRLYLDSFRWKQAEVALQKGLEKGLKSPGQAWLLLGITRVELSQYKAAREALRKAQTYNKYQKQAVAWQRYAEEQRKNERWLSRNG